MPRLSSSNSNGNGNNTTPTKPIVVNRQLHTPVPRVRAGSKDLLTNQEQDYEEYKSTNHNTNANASNGAANNANTANPNTPPPPGLQVQVQQRRTRFNSRDIPRTYSGQYQHNDDQGDLLFRLSQPKVSFSVFLSTYITLVLAVQFGTTFLMATTAIDSSFAHTSQQYSSMVSSWTVTNAVHCCLTLAYIHWFKGSILLDEQGELNAMTLWEQLEATAESTTHMRRTLLILPTVLAYTACVTSNFDKTASAVNVGIWSISMLAKLPLMNGVRLFGINRTAGIDDYCYSSSPTTTTTSSTPIKLQYEG